jgi:uncharacterized protein (UPF0332 family)
MKEETQKRLQKASRAIHAAGTLLRDGEADFAVSRAYYAMFYIAEALLGERGLRFRKHSSVHSAFGERFIKTGLIESKYHRWIIDAFDMRIKGDYGVEAVITDAEATQMIRQAHEFLEVARQFLETRT